MPTGSAECKLSPKARADLEAVWLYSLGEWGLHDRMRASRHLQPKLNSDQILSLARPIPADTGNPFTANDSGQLIKVYPRPYGESFPNAGRGAG